MITFYLCDLETNGLLVGTHEIHEISIINATTKEQLTRQVRVEHPENSSLDAMKITGKTIEDLKKGVSKQKAIADFEEFVNADGLQPANRCLVGHNIITFDKRFLWHLWESQDKIFPFNMYLDTIHMMRTYVKKHQIIKPKINLEASCQMLKVGKLNNNWHSALADTQNCYFLWEKLMQEVDHLMLIKTLPHSINKEDATE